MFSVVLLIIKKLISPLFVIVNPEELVPTDPIFVHWPWGRGGTPERKALVHKEIYPRSGSKITRPEPINRVWKGGCSGSGAGDGADGWELESTGATTASCTKRIPIIPRIVPAKPIRCLSVRRKEAAQVAINVTSMSPLPIGIVAVAFRRDFGLT